MALHKLLLAGVVCALLAANGAALAAQPQAGTAATRIVEPALSAIRLKEFAKAASLLEPLASHGQPDAQYLLASLYRTGLGVPTDPTKEREWLMAAASQGHANAAYSLALLFGREDPRDPAESRRWLERAAAAGHDMAKRSLQRGSLPMEFLPATDLKEPKARLEALHLAARTDDASLVQILASPQSVAATDEFGRDPLMLAAEAGAGNAVKALLAAGANASLADSFGVTALMLAASSGSNDAVTALLAARADVGAQDKVGNTALMHAARNERVDALRLLLPAATTGGSLAARNTEGWNALDWALKGDSVDAIGLLRRAGLTATTPAKNFTSPSIPLRRVSGDLYTGWSDLGVGATRTSSDLLDRLLAGSRPQPWTAKELRAALDSAVKGSNTQAASKLLPAVRSLGAPGVDPVLFDWAIRHGDTGMVAVLMPAFPPAAERPGMQSAVLAAVHARQGEVLGQLLDAGMNARAVDAQGRDALMIAARAGREDMVALLVKAGSDANQVDAEGRSALWYAAKAGFLGGAKLVMRTDNRNRADKLGLTPLAIAASEGRTEMVSWLLEQGAQPNGSGGAGAPLILAAARGHADVVQRLLAAGAPANTSGDRGNTALMVATRQGQATVVKLLLAAGATRQLRNQDGHSASDIADALKHADIEAMLKSG